MVGTAMRIKFLLALVCAASLSLAAQTPTSTTPTTTSDTPAATQDKPAASPDTPAAAPDKAKTSDKDKKKDKIESRDDKEIPKTGSIKDVSAVGNRNVGCSKGMGNWYSLDKQVMWGKQFSEQVEQTSKVIRDPVVNEYINRLAQNIVRNSDAKVPFTVKVLDDDSVNAFALPGGYFYVFSGLILAADNESELAGVMAHEIAHVAACHAAREQTRGQWANFATIPLIFVGGGLGYGIYEAMGIAVPLTFMKFSRGFEADADYLGVQYLYNSGYDPKGMPDMFEKLAALEKKKPGALSKAFDSHPQTPDRIEKTQSEIAQILPPKDQYVIDTSEFQDVKSRLAALENRRKLDNPQDTNRPTLRRSNTGDSKDSGNQKTNDDDRPTLKKRPDQN
jgi:beta-barrel assembly-enhancing protease